MNLKPDMYKKNIYDINYEKLLLMGKKYLFFDLDNTVIPYKKNIVSQQTVNLFDKLNNMGFKCFLFSNSNIQRLRRFKAQLGIDIYHSSMKPLKRNYKKILKEYKKEECVFIGDQIMTDVLGAKRNSLYVIFVDKLGEYEPIYTKFWRFFERIILKKYNKKNIFKKGKYYE